ncbi:Putative divalent-cation tolerance protein CutA [Candidatus Providencia siddallii]|uniref:Putative divalent-cation tolerance protein CutA n=1 Tax=Candidatus Providencia siddallii TaxID=1715285 RepID=A0A0M6W8A7_9GAMM|nr:Putative divalent-cation tolerance protein CutA [Candidatus Providencia siddallii]
MILKEFKPKDSHKLCLIICVTKSYEEAVLISKSLLINRFAACISIFPKIESIYLWKDRIEETKETLLLIKTINENQSNVFEEIKKNHSYEIPEIISIIPNKVEFNYLNWVFNIVKKNN